MSSSRCKKILALALVTLLCRGAYAGAAAKRKKKMENTAVTETATLAGGCFWGMQEILRALPGVIKTTVGYTGGKTD